MVNPTEESCNILYRFIMGFSRLGQRNLFYVYI